MKTIDDGSTEAGWIGEPYNRMGAAASYGAPTRSRPMGRMLPCVSFEVAASFTQPLQLAMNQPITLISVGGCMYDSIDLCSLQPWGDFSVLMAD